MNGGWRRRTFNETTYSTMLFSPSCSSLIPEGKYFFDDDAVGVDRGVEVFSLRGALLLARCFRDDHGHFIMIFYSSATLYTQNMRARPSS